MDYLELKDWQDDKVSERLFMLYQNVRQENVKVIAVQMNEFTVHQIKRHAKNNIQKFGNEKFKPYYSGSTFTCQYNTWHGFKIETMQPDESIAATLKINPERLFCMTFKCVKPNGRIVYFDDINTHPSFL